MQKHAHIIESHVLILNMFDILSISFLISLGIGSTLKLSKYVVSLFLT